MLCRGMAYNNLGNGVYQSNGSDTDTQAAINAAVDANTVIIPNGTWTSSNGIRIAGKSIHLLGQTKGGVVLVHNAFSSSSDWNSLVYIRPSLTAGNNLEVANLVFKEGPVLSGVGHHTEFIIFSLRGSFRIRIAFPPRACL
jgi:hypothetical protein